MRVTAKHGKIQEAIELLNEAAVEKKEEIYGAMGDKYSRLKHLVTEKADNGFHVADQTKKRFVKTLHKKETELLHGAKRIAKQARRNPLVFAGVAAAAAFVAGIILARK